MIRYNGRSKKIAIHTVLPLGRHIKGWCYQRHSSIIIARATADTQKSVLFCLLGMGAIGVSVLAMRQGTFEGYGIGIACGLWACCCLVASLTFWVRKETIRLSATTMRVKIVRARRLSRRTYPLTAIQSFRVNPLHEREHGVLAFRDHRRDWHFGYHLSDDEAAHLVQYLSDVTRYRCHVVEWIVFGDLSTHVDDSVCVAYNPDVSTMATPFFRLTRLLIQTETYDFYQVERFITYAVNTLNPEHMKSSVDVELHGDPQHVHPNLKNSLTALCKCVKVCVEDGVVCNKHGA